VLCNLAGIRSYLGYTTECLYGLHTHDVATEWDALVGRHLGPSEPIRALRAYELRRAALIWGRAVGSEGVLPRLDTSVFLRTRPPNRRKRYAFGLAQLAQRGFRKADANVTAMLKLELHPASTLESKEDRCIQYRSVAYNAAIGRYLAPLEHALYGRWHEIAGAKVMIVKGLTPAVRAMLITDAWRRRFNPVAVCADHSRFDRSVRVEHQEAEFTLYAECIEWDSYIAMLLECQLRNKGRFYDRVKRESRTEYEVKGKRMSGYFNTALGNSVINALVLGLIMPGAEIFIDGDDSVAIFEQDFAPSSSEIIRRCAEFGFSTKCDIATTLEGVEFCQARVVMTRHGPQLVRNPLKTLECLQVSARKIPHEAERLAVLRGKVLCELASYRDVPVITPIMYHLYTPGEVRFENASAEARFHGWFIGVQDTPPEIDDVARTSFARAWNLDHHEQLALEGLGKAAPRLPTSKIRSVAGEPLVFDINTVDDWQGSCEVRAAHRPVMGDWPLADYLSRVSNPVTHAG
jgi:hypothetical protein